jgi:dihydrofolate reductase
MDRIPKIVFSHTLKNLDWHSARLATKDIKEEVSDLKQSRDEGNKDILVGSPSLIVALTKLGLIDEFQLCIHPVIAGSGLPLFKDISDKIVLKLIKQKRLGSGAIVLYYEPEKSPLA